MHAARLTTGDSAERIRHRVLSDLSKEVYHATEMVTPSTSPTSIKETYREIYYESYSEDSNEEAR